MNPVTAAISSAAEIRESAGAVRQRLWKPFIRETRLRNFRQLGQVREEGANRAGRFVVLKAIPAPDGLAKVAIVISRRFSLKAVERNRARRLIRESVRALAPGVQPFWFLFLPRQPIKGQKCGPVSAEVRRFCLELGVYRVPVPPAPESGAGVP